MSKATYPLKLPLSIKKAAQRLAKEDGVSLNQWIAVAVAEKVGVIETAAEFFKKRAGDASGHGLIKFLRAALEDADEPRVLLIALRRIAEARGGVAKVAKAAGIKRESLYRALSVRGNPRLSTLVAVTKAVGLKLTVEAAQ